MKKVLFVTILLIANGALADTSITKACTNELQFGLSYPGASFVRQCMDLAKEKNLTAEDIKQSGCQDTAAVPSGFGGYLPSPDLALSCLKKLYGDHQKVGDSVKCDILYSDISDAKSLKQREESVFLKNNEDAKVSTFSTKLETVLVRLSIIDGFLGGPVVKTDLKTGIESKIYVSTSAKDLYSTLSFKTVVVRVECQ